MGVAIEAYLPHSPQQFAKGRAPAQIGAEDESIDEKADQPFEFSARTVGRGRTDDDVFLAGISAQQNLKRCQQSHERGHAFALAQFVQRRGQRCRQSNRLPAAVKTLARRPSMISRQIEHRRIGKLFFPVREVGVEHGR